MPLCGPTRCGCAVDSASIHVAGDGSTTHPYRWESYYHLVNSGDPLPDGGDRFQGMEIYYSTAVTPPSGIVTTGQLVVRTAAHAPVSVSVTPPPTTITTTGRLRAHTTARALVSVGSATCTNVLTEPFDDLDAWTLVESGADTMFGVSIYHSTKGTSYPAEWDLHVSLAGGPPTITRAFGTTGTFTWTWPNVPSMRQSITEDGVTNVWVSLKPTTTQLAAIAAGTYNTRWSTILDQIPDDYITMLTLWHEPENDAADGSLNFQTWLNANIQLGNIVQSKGRAELRFGPVFMGDYYISGVAASNPGHLPSLITDAVGWGLLDDWQASVDFIGWDPYHEGSDGGSITPPRDQPGYYFDGAYNFTTTNFPGTPMAIGETGFVYRSTSPTAKPTWLNLAAQWAIDHDLMACCYYDAMLTTPWYLSFQADTTIHDTVSSALWGSYYTLAGDVGTIVPGRTGTALQLHTASSTVKYQYPIPVANRSDYVTFGFAVRLSNITPSVNLTTFMSADGGEGHGLLTVASDGRIRYYRGGTTTSALLGSSAANLIAVNTWYYIEVRAYIANTGGYATIRVNGTNAISITNVDTRNTGTAVVNAVALRGAYNGVVTSLWDDLYLSTGPGCTFQGDPHP